MSTNRAGYPITLLPQNFGANFKGRMTDKQVRRNSIPLPVFHIVGLLTEETMGRGLLLWLIGVPIPVIIILWLVFGH